MILNEFIPTAMAQAAGSAAKEPSMLELFGMPALMLVMLYFVFIRPQAKKQKDHQKLMNELKAGDEVITTGGIIGRVKSISELFITIEASANTTLKIQKSHVTGLTPKAAKKS